MLEYTYAVVAEGLRKGSPEVELTSAMSSVGGVRQVTLNLSPTSACNRRITILTYVSILPFLQHT